jgi:hypothetical protein
MPGNCSDDVWLQCNGTSGSSRLIGVDEDMAKFDEEPRQKDVLS